MAKHHLQASFENSKQQVNIGLGLILWEDNGIFFQYSPALDLTGYGNTETEARESFNYQLNEFVTYTINKGTVYEELERLGWAVNKKKKRIVAPLENELLEENETYRNLITRQGINKTTTNLALAL